MKPLPPVTTARRNRVACPPCSSTPMVCPSSRERRWWSGVLIEPMGPPQAVEALELHVFVLRAVHAAVGTQVAMLDTQWPVLGPGDLSAAGSRHVADQALPLVVEAHVTAVSAPLPRAELSRHGSEPLRVVGDELADGR